MMVGENRHVGTKRMLDEEHINGIMGENPGGGARLLLPLSADAYAWKHGKWVRKKKVSVHLIKKWRHFVRPET